MATYFGFLESHIDALLVIQAARHGQLPRVLGRLPPQEAHSQVRSGAVFVFIREESRIKRWTDRRKWTQSRANDPYFFVYREGTGKQNRGQPQGPRCQRFEEPEVKKLVGNLQGKGVKKDGLVKKTFSIYVDGRHYMVVSYYTKHDVDENRLPIPSTSPSFENVRISEDLWEALKKLPRYPKARPRHSLSRRSPTPPLVAPHTTPPAYTEPHKPPPYQPQPFSIPQIAYTEPHKRPPYQPQPFSIPQAAYTEPHIPLLYQPQPFSIPQPRNMTGYREEPVAAPAWANGNLSIFSNIDECSFEAFQYQVLLNYILLPPYHTMLSTSLPSRYTPSTTLSF